MPTGTRVFDWTVPREWNIRDAYVATPGASRSSISAARTSTSSATASRSGGDAARRAPDPSSHAAGPPRLDPLPDLLLSGGLGILSEPQGPSRPAGGDYEVVIDSTLADGSLTYGELVLRGRTKDEILISATPATRRWPTTTSPASRLATILASISGGRLLAPVSYRFLFIPGTIGAITWLARNEAKARGIKHGLVLAGVGDPGRLTYKRSRRGDAADRPGRGPRARPRIAGRAGPGLLPLRLRRAAVLLARLRSPGGRISRTPFGEYPEYHTSARRPGLRQRGVAGRQLGRRSWRSSTSSSRTGPIVNLNPKGEPQLGRRGLYASPGAEEMALLWVLNLSDGRTSLLDIAERSGLGFESMQKGGRSTGRGEAPGRPSAREVLMKVVLFCGGLGMRLREYSETIPKPMVQIGYRPILWHVMRYYAHYGHKEFILCLGHRGDAHQEVLSELRRVRLQRLRPDQGGQGSRPPEQRHPRLEDHLRRHGHERQHRPAAVRRPEVPGGRRRSSWPTTPTA